jgi:hypothetical protein
MSKRLQNTEMNIRLPRVMLGAAALLVMLSATSVAPASAQGAPDQLRYLDPPKSSAVDAQAQLTDDQRAKVRNSYARVSIKKHQVQH